MNSVRKLIHNDDQSAWDMILNFRKNYKIKSHVYFGNDKLDKLAYNNLIFLLYVNHNDLCHGFTSPFEYKVGDKLKNQLDEEVTIIGHTFQKNYECAILSDGAYIYDRSNSKLDTGRITGTCHYYTHPQNILRGNKNIHKLFVKFCEDYHVTQDDMLDKFTRIHPLHPLVKKFIETVEGL
jgi:hypothetical protein